MVILTGAGRAFSAGLDLEELGNGAAIHGRKEVWADTSAAVRSFSGPVIGAINGAAVTGGFPGLDHRTVRRRSWGSTQPEEDFHKVAAIGIG